MFLFCRRRRSSLELVLRRSMARKKFWIDTEIHSNSAEILGGSGDASSLPLLPHPFALCRPQRKTSRLRSSFSSARGAPRGGGRGCSFSLVSSSSNRLVGFHFIQILPFSRSLISPLASYFRDSLQNLLFDSVFDPRVRSLRSSTRSPRALPYVLAFRPRLPSSCPSAPRRTMENSRVAWNRSGKQ